MKTTAIIVAAGKGKRMGGPKQFLKIAGKPMLWWTLCAFQAAKIIDDIILVVNAEDIKRARGFNFSKLVKIVVGGKERSTSVNNALRELNEDTGIVVIHDGARPLVSQNIILEAVRNAARYGAVVVGIPVKDTIKQMTSEGRNIIKQTLAREHLWAAQTPQVFRKDLILKAYRKRYNKRAVTDDAMLVERLGYPVKMLMGDYQNIKVTTPDDLAIAEGILKQRKGEKP